MNRTEIVGNIPLDQNAKATIDIKRFLLSKLTVIKENRQVIESNIIRQKQEEVLDAYKKAVKWSDVVKRIVNAEEEAEKARAALLKLGLTKDGTLLEINDDHHGKHGVGYTIRDYRSHDTQEITRSEALKIQEVHDLLKAVRAEMSVFSTYDQLETRMMLCQTVGECMAVINAVADRDVFELKPGTLAIEGKK